jgi:hypothetical protein
MACSRRQQFFADHLPEKIWHFEAVGCMRRLNPSATTEESPNMAEHAPVVGAEAVLARPEAPQDAPSAEHQPHVYSVPQPHGDQAAANPYAAGAPVQVPARLNGR